MGDGMKLYANLHTHSTHSDGKFSPAELAKIAYDEGYRAFSVTDHDTVTGNAEGKAAAEALGMEYIFGAEFRASSGPHIVGFDFDPEYPKMKEYLRQMSFNSAEQTRIIFEWAVEKGNIKGITWDEVLAYNEGISWLCNDHVFRAMLAKGLLTKLDYYDFFLTNFRKQRGMVPPTYQFLDSEELLTLIHDAGGLVVFAHPHNMIDRVKALIPLGLDGVEIYHPGMTSEEQRELMKLAYENDLFISGGTDHAGLCGGMYASFEEPEKCKFYLEPGSFGVMKQHFDELKARSIKGRCPAPEYWVDTPNRI
jgi:predicted metal-dependent phosphoesterase TrpH